MDLYVRLNKSSHESKAFRSIPHLEPLTREELAIITEPNTTFILNEDQRPRAFKTNYTRQAPMMNEAAVPITSHGEPYNGVFDFNQMPTSIDISPPPQLESVPSTQPQFDGNPADETRRNGEEEQEGTSSRQKGKKKKAPRYDKMFKCVSCDSKDMERTPANAHVLKFHEGLVFDQVMVVRPNKWRPSKLRESSIVESDEMVS